MGHATPKPKHLAAKLLTIRKTHGLTQQQLGNKIKTTASRISEFERGRRSPDLILLLAYARLADIPIEHIVDDDIDLTSF